MRESGQPLLIPCVYNLVNGRGAVNGFVNASAPGMYVVREDIISLVQRALRDGPFSMRQLAEDAGLKYDVLRAWAIGRRAPMPENLSRIASGFEARAARLNAIAAELREAATGISERGTR